MEDGRVSAEEPDDRDGEAEELLPVGDGLGREEARRRALDGVFEERGCFEVGVFVDDVVEAAVLDPLEADLGYASPLLVVVEVLEEKKIGGFGLGC